MINEYFGQDAQNKQCQKKFKCGVVIDGSLLSLLHFFADFVIVLDIELY
jgi:hypothetical protein